MGPTELRTLLEALACGECSVPDAAERISALPYTDLGDAKVDHHRELRCGTAEVIFCQGKTPEQVCAIASDMLRNGEAVLGTRATVAHFSALAQVAPDARYDQRAHVLVVDRRAQRPAVGHIVVASAGTADMPVAEEAALCAEAMGNRVSRLYDVGVAGVHRLLAHESLLRDARAIVAVAGMEGALPSLVTGLVSCPVIGVPTSVGYGTSFGGVSALLTMLNSCASGLSVVNIDNGFGGAAIASRINQTAAAGTER